MRVAYWTIAAAAAGAQCWVLPVSSFAPPTMVKGQRVASQKNINHEATAWRTASVLFAMPQNDNKDKDSTTLFSTISPGNDEDDRKNTSSDGNDNAMDIGTIGVQALSAIFAALVLFGASSVIIDMTSSAAQAFGSELIYELGKFAQNIAWVIGSLLKFVAGVAWESAKVAAPAVGGALVEGAKVAAPVVQDAAQQLGDAAAPVIQDAAHQFSDAAAPVVQEATRQVSEAASPYMNSVSEAVVAPISSAVDAVSSQAAEAVGTVSSQAAEMVVAPIRGAADAVSNRVDETVVAPIRGAADAVSSTVDETLAPIKSVGESIQIRAF
mmetsp:Transcript_25025/g.52940  ORF Transcript_25025/g.52940 Transcript_25025/m.52940 type:complete len:325 (-) Transcript_25025:347-1321(-)